MKPGDMIWYSKDGENSYLIVLKFASNFKQIIIQTYFNTVWCKAIIGGLI